MRRLVPELPRVAWIVVGGVFLSALGSGMTLPFFVVYLHRVRGIDLGLAGLALAAVALASFAGNVAAGALADGFGARRTLVIGLVVAAAGTAGFAFVTDAPEAVAAAAVIGLGVSVCWPSEDALLASAVAVHERSSAFSLKYATLNLGFGFGAVAAAVIADLGSVRSFQVLYLADAATFLLFVPLLYGLRGVRDRVAVEPHEEPGGFRTVARDRVFVRLWLLAVALFVVGYAQYQASFPAYATGTGGIGSHALGVAFAANTFGVAAFQLFVLRLLTGLRRTTAVALGALGWACAWGITIAAAHAGGGAAAVAGFALAMAVFALGECCLSPTLGPIANDLAPDRLRGRYNGALALAYTTGYTIGPLLAGVSLKAGDGTPFFVALVAACVAAALATRGLRRLLPDEIDVLAPV